MQVALMSDALMTTYARLPVTFSKGEGAWLWDEQGKKYLDAVSGVAVCSLGHAHPTIAAALCAQAQTLVHTSNLYGIANQQALGDRLVQLAGMDRVFFANSGAEANEAAIKLARLHGHRKGIDNPLIIVAEGSFHGRTLATLSATGNRKVQAGFEPLVSGFVRVPYDDIEAIRTVAKNTQGVAALLLEPIQGEGGVHVPGANYLREVRALCDQHGWLMMLDEIQSGMGRTGALFAFQHEGAAPDVMTLAKALGNGVPIGACLARGEAAELFKPGNHGSTFGGNPLACAAGLAVLDVMQQDDLPARAAALGARIQQGLAAALGDNPHVVEVRGKGLLLGVELDRPCGDLVNRALAEGLLINVTADRVVRLLPPLILSDAEADQIIQQVSQLILAFLQESPS
jgi:acetylornithine aminotransferase